MTSSKTQEDKFPQHLTFISPIYQSPTFNHTSTFFKRAQTPLRRPHRAQKASIRVSANNKPPDAKPIYYKNPSKAIEKGGGFYIPGLRGPRLRVFVGIISASLLALNHIAGRDVSSASLRVSETLAAIAIISVLATVIVEIGGEGGEESDKTQGSIGEEPSVTTESVALDGANGTAVAPEELEWAAAVSTDLTAVRGIAVVRDGRLVYAKGEVGSAAPPGAAVERVARENQSLYVDDSSTLPEHIDFPFLTGSADAWSVFMVPVNGGQDVVVFATDKKAGASGPSLSSRDRSWLEQMSRRMGGSLL